MIDPVTESIDVKLARRASEERVKKAEAARKRYLAKKEYIQYQHQKYEEAPDSEKRVCLRCSKKFSSKSKQNRICYECKQSSEFSTSAEAYSLVGIE